MTPAERTALAFVSGVLVLGGAVRAVRAWRAPPVPAASARALAAQRAAVESAAARDRRAGKKARPRKRPVLPSRPVDVDRAPAAVLDSLPRIGPGLAARIVADRAAHGPFGSLEGLGRVPGIGAATLRAVQPYVTFSLPPRPPVAGSRATSRRDDGVPRP